MPTNAIEHAGSYQLEFDRLQQEEGVGQDYLRQLREPAMQRFLELGFPTIRDEEWIFTNLKSIASKAFVSPEPDAGEDVLEATIAPYRLGGHTGPLLVFVDGFFRPDLSHVAHPSTGLTATSLGHAIELNHELVFKYLTFNLDYQNDALTALHTAFLSHGAFIHVNEGVNAAEPVHILNVATGGSPAAGSRPCVTHPHNLIVAEARGSVNVIEHYVSLNDGFYWTNAATEVALGPDARVGHYLIEEENEQACNISTLAAAQDERSHFESHTILLGGALVRNNVWVELEGDDATLLVNGLFLGRATQHMDNHMRIVHAAQRCSSRQFYKGILEDQAHGVFTGRIIVRPGAQKTDAKQTNRNLLLSDEAQIDSRPQLEIYADDVKCTHGATTGQLDGEALFYLRSRGIDPESARALLIYAFAQEGLDRITLPLVRKALEERLQRRLPYNGVLHKLLPQADSGIKSP